MLLSSLQWLVVLQHSILGVDLPVFRALLSLWWVLVPEERGVCFVDLLHGSFWGGGRGFMKTTDDCDNFEISYVSEHFKEALNCSFSLMGLSEFLVKALHAGASCFLWSLVYVLENKAKCRYLWRSVEHINNNWELFLVAIGVGVIPQNLTAREGYVSKGNIFGTEVSHVFWWVIYYFSIVCLKKKKEKT